MRRLTILVLACWCVAALASAQRITASTYLQQTNPTPAPPGSNETRIWMAGDDTAKAWHVGQAAPFTLATREENNAFAVKQGIPSVGLTPKANGFAAGELGASSATGWMVYGGDGRTNQVPRRPARIVTVSPTDASADFATLAGAVAEAGLTTPSVVEVWPGTYDEKNLILPRGVSLVGVDRQTCVISADGDDTPFVAERASIIRSLGDNAIRNLTIRNTNTAGEAYSMCLSVGYGATESDGVATQSVIEHVRCEGSSGFAFRACLTNGDLVIVRDCEFVAGHGALAAWGYGTSALHVYDSYSENNNGQQNLWLSGAINVIVMNTRFHEASTDAGSVLFDGDNQSPPDGTKVWFYGCRFTRTAALLSGYIFGELKDDPGGLTYSVYVDQGTHCGGLKKTIPTSTVNVYATAQFWGQTDISGAFNTSEGGTLNGYFQATGNWDYAGIPMVVKAADAVGWSQKLPADNYPRFRTRISDMVYYPYIEFGDGASALDTNLYRSEANTLKTDDALIVGAGLSVMTTSWQDFSAVASARGNVSGYGTMNTASADYGETGWIPNAIGGATYLSTAGNGATCNFALPYMPGTVLTQLRVKWQAGGTGDGVKVRLVKRDESGTASAWSVVGAQQTYTDAGTPYDVTVSAYDYTDETMAANTAYNIEVESVVAADESRLYAVSVETSKRVY